MLLICTNVQISSKESASEDNIVHNPEIIVLFFFIIVIHVPGHGLCSEPGRFRKKRP